ncbi:CoA ester lyase [Paraburkholderia sp. EG286B]|uniref:CoA ester lyase n=1 Tax=Paraburkholderia sp. EG286B TaxID=3237011 RepID=UPI0034D35036
MIRSLLFAPANRLDLLAKMHRANADCNVIDLEDGTPEADKLSARAQLDQGVRGLRESGVRGLVYVRVNAPRSAHFFDDVRAAMDVRPDGIVIPKLEAVEELEALIAAERSGGPKLPVLAGIESMRGVANIYRLLADAPQVHALYFGAEDFASEIGARRTPGGHEVLYARSRVLMAARINGVIAIDQAVGEVRDDQRFRDDSTVGRELGYQGKICVTPRQVELTHATFTPSDEEVARARRMLDAYRESAARGLGTVVVDGMLVEGPLVKRAEGVVALADQLSKGHDP